MRLGLFAQLVVLEYYSEDFSSRRIEDKACYSNFTLLPFNFEFTQYKAQIYEPE